MFSKIKLYLIIVLLILIIALISSVAILYSKNSAKKVEIEKLNLKIQTLEESLQSTEKQLQDLKKIHEAQQRAYNKFIHNLNKIDKYDKEKILKALNNETIN